jgi:hypothetical protein
MVVLSGLFQQFIHKINDAKLITSLVLGDAIGDMFNLLLIAHGVYFLIII